MFHLFQWQPHLINILLGDLFKVIFNPPATRDNVEKGYPWVSPPQLEVHRKDHGAVESVDSVHTQDFNPSKDGINLASHFRRLSFFVVVWDEDNSTVLLIAVIFTVTDVVASLQRVDAVARGTGEFLNGRTARKGYFNFRVLISAGLLPVIFSCGPIVPAPGISSRKAKILLSIMSTSEWAKYKKEVDGATVFSACHWFLPWLFSTSENCVWQYCTVKKVGDRLKCTDFGSIYM